MNLACGHQLREQSLGFAFPLNFFFFGFFFNGPIRLQTSLMLPR